VKIESNLFKDIQIALLKKQVSDSQTTTRIREALIKAGLDPNKNYTMNEIEETVEEVISRS